MNNNPLTQYFRRPAVYVRLPSGGVGYLPDAIDMPENNELPVYPMTAIDEITVRTPDALFNGTAIVELIKSCIPNIKDPWSVPNVDLDAILIAIKAASSQSGNMEIESACPSCEEVSTYSIALAGLLTSIGSPDFSELLEINDLKIKFKPLHFKDVNEASLKQFEWQRVSGQIDSIDNEDERKKLVTEALHNITDITMDLLSRSVEYIETPSTQVNDPAFILDFLKHCDRNTYVSIRDYSASLREKSELQPMTVTCPSCGKDHKQSITLNPVDFFG